MYLNIQTVVYYYPNGPHNSGQDVVKTWEAVFSAKAAKGKTVQPVHCTRYLVCCCAAQTGFGRGSIPKAIGVLASPFWSRSPEHAKPRPLPSPPLDFFLEISMLIVCDEHVSCLDYECVDSAGVFRLLNLIFFVVIARFFFIANLWK